MKGMVLWNSGLYMTQIFGPFDNQEEARWWAWKKYSGNRLSFYATKRAMSGYDSWPSGAMWLALTKTKPSIPTERQIQNAKDHLKKQTEINERRKREEKAHEYALHHAQSD